MLGIFLPRISYFVVVVVVVVCLQAVLAVDCANKESIYGYHGNRPIPFLRITMALPKLVAPAKRILESGFRCPQLAERAYSTYESNIDYEVSVEYYNLGQNCRHPLRTPSSIQR